MPKPVLPSHDSASYELLSLTALCGEFPCDSAARFIDSESYRKKIVTGLTHNRLLRIFSRNHLRGYRLGIRGKRLLQDQDPERFLFPRKKTTASKSARLGKGPAYERWAKVYNLKQMAAALQYLQEHHLTDYAALTASTEAAVDHFHKLSDELRTTEEALSKTSELMAATVDYAKTRPVFDGYKAARYSKKYLAQHEAELATYRAAKDTMNTILNGAKLPKIEALKKSRRELAGQKKALYAEYREAQRQMREAVAIKANIDHLLGITDERENKAQER